MVQHFRIEQQTEQSAQINLPFPVERAEFAHFIYKVFPVLNAEGTNNPKTEPLKHLVRREFNNRGEFIIADGPHLESHSTDYIHANIPDQPREDWNQAESYGYIFVPNTHKDYLKIIKTEFAHNQVSRLHLLGQIVDEFSTAYNNVVPRILRQLEGAAAQYITEANHNQPTNQHQVARNLIQRMGLKLPANGIINTTYSTEKPENYIASRFIVDMFRLTESGVLCGSIGEVTEALVSELRTKYRPYLGKGSATTKLAQLI